MVKVTLRLLAYWLFTATTCTLVHPLFAHRVASAATCTAETAAFSSRSRHHSNQRNKDISFVLEKPFFNPRTQRVVQSLKAEHSSADGDGGGGLDSRQWHDKSNEMLSPDPMGRRSAFYKASGWFVALTISLLSAKNEILQPAAAAYGDGTNIELPSYIDFLIEKNAVADSSTFLYKGADRDVQLQRLSAARERLQGIPAICSSRKWSQVDGVLTGPLGTLIQTMNQVSGGASSASKNATKAAAKVKADLLAIGQAAARKDATLCTAASESALASLEAFVKVAF